MMVYTNFNFRSIAKSQLSYDTNVFEAKQKSALHARLVQAGIAGETICAVGDSITYGVDWDDELFARYTGLIPSADMGVNGDTSKEVLARINTILATNADIYMIAVGCNDIRHVDSVEGNTTIEGYISTMANIIGQMRAINADVFIVSIWPSWTADQYPATTNKYGTTPETNSQIDNYNAAMRKWCIDNGVGWINATKYIRSVINTVELEQTYSADGIHPNALGRVIYADGCLNEPE